MTLEESEALVISCYLNVEAGLPGCRNAFAERVALLRRAVGPEHKETLEEGLGKTVIFIKDHVQPGTRGVAVFARGGSQPFFLPFQFRVPLPTSIAVDATSKEGGVMLGHTDLILDLAVSPDGTRVPVGAFDETCVVPPLVVPQRAFPRATVARSSPESVRIVFTCRVHRRHRSKVEFHITGQSGASLESGSPWTRM